MNKLMEKMMLTMMNNNPQVAQIIKEIRESGLTAEEYFYKKTKEMNVDPEEILKQLK